MSALRNYTLHAQTLMMRLALFLIAVGAAVSVVATALAAFGVWPWLSLEAGFGGTLYPNAGAVVQVVLTAVMVMLAFYLPANTRIMALERSHRNFAMNMNDVVRAYHAAHTADRASKFHISSEFDEVKERLSFLRDHPDLGDLEPDVLELAAQMSQVSQELADVYSDAKVQRARVFLKQRQEEIDQFNERLDDAKIVMQELRQWTRDVEIEESVARSQLMRLREELFDLLPELSAQLRAPDDGSDPDATSVVPMQPPRAAE